VAGCAFTGAQPNVKEMTVQRTFNLMVVAALAVSACASEPVPVTKWSKPGGTEAAFMTVHYACVRNVRAQSAGYFVAGARYPGTNGAVGEFIDDIGADFGFEDPAPGRGLDVGLFHGCMNAYGWTADAKGFAPPPGDEVPMSE
jgi:hypothetical protein